MMDAFFAAREEGSGTSRDRLISGRLGAPVTARSHGASAGDVDIGASGAGGRSGEGDGAEGVDGTGEGVFEVMSRSHQGFATTGSPSLDQDYDTQDLAPWMSPKSSGRLDPGSQGKGGASGTCTGGGLPAPEPGHTASGPGVAAPGPSLPVLGHGPGPGPSGSTAGTVALPPIDSARGHL